MRGRLRLHEEAGAEYDAAFDWYLARNKDAAVQLSEEFERALADIARASAMGRRPARYEKISTKEISLHYCLPRVGVWRDPNRRGSPHEPQAGILEGAHLVVETKSGQNPVIPTARQDHPRSG